MLQLLVAILGRHNFNKGQRMKQHIDRYNQAAVCRTEHMYICLFRSGYIRTESGVPHLQPSDQQLPPDQAAEPQSPQGVEPAVCLCLCLCSNVCQPGGRPQWRQAACCHCLRPCILPESWTAPQRPPRSLPLSARPRFVRPQSFLSAEPNRAHSICNVSKDASRAETGEQPTILKGTVCLSS